ncbi:MAG TPA: hypothetical protein VF761_14085 [Gemmatimonadaceae bacterium]
MRRLSKWLVRAGLAVWALGAAAAISGVWVTMPPIVVEWLVLSLAVTSGALLVVAGLAIARRPGPDDQPPGVPPGRSSAGDLRGRGPELDFPVAGAFRSPVIQREGANDRAT